MPDWLALVAAAPRLTLKGEVLRLVESQEQVATNLLVSSLERQAVLEEMLEETKPPRRPGTERLHYLLATPFRYPPLHRGSRFGRRHEPSLFYGALTERTVLAEATYYRFVFWYGMAVPPPAKLNTQHTLFGARYQSSNGLRLHQPPFDDHADVLRHPADYSASQALGTVMREGGNRALRVCLRTRCRGWMQSRAVHRPGIHPYPADPPGRLALPADGRARALPEAA